MANLLMYRIKMVTSQNLESMVDGGDFKVTFMRLTLKAHCL